MIYHVGLPVRRKFISMDVVLGDATLERVMAADVPQIMGQPNLIKDANVPVTVIDKPYFSSVKEFDAFMYRLQSKLRNKHNNKPITFYPQYGVRTKQFSKKERYMLGCRMRLRRLSFEQALSIPLQTEAIPKETVAGYANPYPGQISTIPIPKITFAAL